jgi:hypothetical protein
MVDLQNARVSKDAAKHFEWEVRPRCKKPFVLFSEASPLFLFAPVAQWIERQPPELKAAGSIPAGRTNNNRHL